MIAIGIDLGTTNSCAAVHGITGTKVIVFDDGKKTMPSVVCFSGDAPVVGTAAKRQAILHPDETIISVKRLMGKLDDAGKRVTVKIKNKEYKPEVISSIILKEIKIAAEKFLGEKVDSAVITVPAYFESDEREATKEAGKIAGLNVLRIMNEPTAAALAYGLGENMTDTSAQKNIIVFDLGGGTFDVTLLCLEGKICEVKATNGDRYLGGDDFDNEIVNWITDKFIEENGINRTAFLSDKVAKQRMREAAETAKIELSGMLETTISLPMLFSDPTIGKGYNFNSLLSRAKFDSLTKHLVEKTRAPMQTALTDADWNINNVDEVVMVGGSTRIPAIQKMVSEFFNNKTLNFSINPDEVVAEGAAVQASLLSGITTSQNKGIVLLDVLPLSLGIEEHGGLTSFILRRNTTIPCEKTEVYSTVYDNQMGVEIKVVQGERALAADNKLLGKFILNIMPSPRGVPEIAVKFDVDADGILHVSATDKKTGKTEKITIQKSNLSTEEINRAIQESKEYDEADKMAKELVTRKSRLEVLLYEAENLSKSITESGMEELNNLKNRISDSMNSDTLKTMSEKEVSDLYVKYSQDILDIRQKFAQEEKQDSSSEDINSANTEETMVNDDTNKTEEVLNKEEEEDNKV